MFKQVQEDMNILQENEKKKDKWNKEGNLK